MKLMLSIALCPAGCNMEGQTHQFDTDGGSFGRAPDNNWVLPDPSRYVSSRHGSIRFENNQFLLIDESTNGIYVNGASLPLGSAQPLVLKDGDLLVFGDYRIQTNIEETTNIPPSEFTNKVGAAAGGAGPASANPVFVDDLDKWLEPSAPVSESVMPSRGAINISSSPLVQSADSIDLGLKAEEKDPLALLGLAQQKSVKSQGAASGSLTDLLGDTPFLEQQMMKVPKVIPDDWDELLGGRPAEQSEAKPADPIQLTPLSVQSKPLEPLPLESELLDPDKTACIEAASILENQDDQAPAPVQISKTFSESELKAPDTLDLSELLATPSEQLKSDLSAELQLPEKDLVVQPEGEDIISSLVTSDIPKPLTSEPSDAVTSDEPEAATCEPSEAVTIDTPEPVARDIPKKLSVEKQDLQTSDGADLARALGLDRLSVDQQNVLNETVANTVKETVAGMMRTLRTRSEIKSEFRMNMTTIQSAENNPLKFSVTPEDAIENMFAKEGKAYLSPIDAMNDGFSDISEHQVALFDAMRAAYEHILGQFDPNALAKKFEKTSSKRFLGSGKGRNWDAYLALFEEYKEDNELTFKRLFGEVFADAYERRMHSLKMSRNSSSSNKAGK